jgi:cell migration-inducing and hyaluronan-binding protein
LTARLPPRLKNSLDSDSRGNVVKDGAETRAAVALLSRSIRIVSAGLEAGEDFPREATGYSYGAHMVIRQGFTAVQIQGVEFVQMGQGGRLGHYPIHFHMARQTPGRGPYDGTIAKGTYVKDSSINESMTRWIVLHSTLGVTLQRNVGYKSIGHGFYLEDGTETDNKFYSNIGIFARAAVDNIQNPRTVPGILAANQETRRFPFLTDSTYPSVFWITNGWNDFIGNMAAGAGACGTAYWFVPVSNSDTPEVMSPSNVEDGTHMKWSELSGYAALQNNLSGTTPLKSFYKNYATSTMMSFQTTVDVPPCDGVVKANDAATENVLKVVKSIAPDPQPMDHYYPRVQGPRFATRCPLGTDGKYNCKGIRACSPGQEESCAVTVLDHFTSAFHWAEYNIAAIWLRPQWYLVTNSVISDVQNGGLTFVTGGDYTHASVIKGYWALVRNSVFIGRTQQSNGFSSDAGPFNTASGLACEWQKQAAKVPNVHIDKSYCLSRDEGISMPMKSAFGLGQQLFHIYDGPAYQESNAYLDITTTPCPLIPNPNPKFDPGCMYNSNALLGVPKDKNDSCYLPNAAIGWKQPNGFFYPPAFHSTNLFFSNVDIRHYVVDPLFQAPQGVKGKDDFGQGGTYLTATSGPNDVKSVYCTWNDAMFNNFSGIDRQTVLNDDDGSLTGLSNTISINEDVFFSAPVETAECKGNLGVSPSLACPKAKPPTPSTAKTSPYDYIITAVAPGCSQNDPAPYRYGRCGDDVHEGNGGNRWSSKCTDENCYGVPLFRQFLTNDEQTRWNAANCTTNKGDAKCRWPFIRMAGQNMHQRHTLTLNGGTYYLDTSIPLDTQQNEPFTTKTGAARDVNVFEGGQTYYVFFVYAKPSTKQTYLIYVGDGFKEDTIKPVRGNIANAPVKFSDGANSPKWLTKHGVKDRVLAVTVDFSAYKDEFDPTNSDNGLCGPKTFCKWEKKDDKGKDTGACVSNLADTDPQLAANKSLKAELDATCRNWAVKDLDCPTKGCFGFTFTLDGNFNKQPDGTLKKFPDWAARPTPNKFPGDWTTQFVRTTTEPDNKSQVKDGIESECYYPKLPPDCKSLAAGARQPKQGRAVGNRR